MRPHFGDRGNQKMNIKDKSYKTKNDIVYCFYRQEKKHGRVVLRLCHPTLLIILYRQAFLTIFLSNLHTIRRLPSCLCAHLLYFFFFLYAILADKFTFVLVKVVPVECLFAYRHFFSPLQHTCTYVIVVIL